MAAQTAARDARRMGIEPALAIAQGRPIKRERRSFDQAGHGQGSRWSARIDDNGDGNGDSK